jgi:hypothetical protein
MHLVHDGLEVAHELLVLVNTAVLVALGWAAQRRGKRRSKDRS